MDPTISPKAYWSILKTFLNNKKYLAFHQFLIITIVLLIFKRRLRSSTISLLSSVITDFLYQRKQRVVLNGQHSSWTNVETGIPQGSTLGPLFFLIYINDSSDGLTSNPKLFANDTSLFSVVQNINSTANDLNSDLMKISDLAFQWKMRFNSDLKKQAQEVIFSRKINKIDHPPLYFNQN